MNPLTIVIATYNSADFIDVTLRSALRCHPAEIIVSDDASSDQTVEITQRSQRQFPGVIRIRRNPRNVGLTRNWNGAMELVTTEFALKLDHDDIVLPAYASRAVEFLSDHPHAEIVAAVSSAPWSYPGPVPDLDAFDPPRGGFLVLNAIEACDAILRWRPYPVSSSTMYRMSAWRRIGGFDERLSYCNDREIWFRFALGGSIALFTGVGALERRHAGNFTRVVMRHEEVCREFDHMFSKARQLWPAPALYRRFAGVYLATAKNCFGSALRLRWLDPRAAARAARGMVLASRSAALYLMCVFRFTNIDRLTRSIRQTRPTEAE
jgi:glycosyltransferase involved in cell wall biosynthesis